MAWSKRPHRPVRMNIVDNGMKVQHFVCTVTPTLPQDQIIGPRKQPADWSTIKALAQACTEIANDDNCDVEVVWFFMSRVWAKFAVQAAMDIADATGTDLREPDAFGCNLRPRWVDVTYQEQTETK
eukprot:3310577-Pyramimonas_sp.AAC.1